MSSSLGRMQTSTPIQNSPQHDVSKQVQELQRKTSRLQLENETLQCELDQTKRDVEMLSLENEQLRQMIQEKDIIQTKMGRQLNMLTETAYAFYEKFTAFKRRYYEEQNAWYKCANEK